MKHSYLLSYLAAIILLAVLCNSAIAKEERVSRPLEYSGYSEKAYSDIEKRSFYVPMSDGEKLAIDAYLPDGGPAESWPVIIEYTPYTRAFIDIKNGPLRRLNRKTLLKTESPVLDMLTVPGGMADAIKEMISYGYVFVRADIRGCGASTGWKADFMPRIGKDGGELVNWIAKQPWCDGNVGMIGGSYAGYSQIVTAGNAGPALKAIAPTVVPLDGYNGQVYPGGVYHYKFMHDYGKRLGTLNLNYYTLDPLKILFKVEADMFLPAAPVTDEDGDGELFDEIPLDKNGNGSFLDDYGYPEDVNDPPEYKDGSRRDHIYYLATADHRENADYHFWAQNLMYLDAYLPEPLGQYQIYDFSPGSQVPKVMEKDIAVYNIGGWHDTFARGTTEYFCTMRKTNPSRMLFSPGYHSGGGPYWEYLGEEDVKFVQILLPELRRFFDYYLKGVDNGFADEPPVLIYVQNGEGFRQEQEWPLERELKTDFYFNSGHALSREQGQAGSDRYQADFTHDARYGKKEGNRWLASMGVTPEVLPWRTELDKKCLTYTSGPLSTDMEVTGHPVVKLWVSNTAKYGDFFVYLEDVNEKGKALLVTEGVHRGGFMTERDNDRSILAGRTGVDVKPELPWHGYEKADYTPEVFADGRVVKLFFDLKPTSWVFREGHSIRVSIAMADWLTFRLHPRLSKSNDAHDPANILPVITVHRDDERPSGIMLPVIP